MVLLFFLADGCAWCSGQDGARARWGTNTSNATEWACEGAVGGVCKLILPEVRIDSVSLKGPMVPAKARDGTEGT